MMTQTEVSNPEWLRHNKRSLSKSVSTYGNSDETIEYETTKTVHRMGDCLIILLLSLHLTKNSNYLLEILRISRT